MFSDSLVALMTVQLLCFVGILVIFVFIVRSLSTQTAALRDCVLQQQTALADMERQLIDVAAQVRRFHASTDAAQNNFAQTTDLGTLLSGVTSDCAPRLQEELAAASTAPFPAAPSPVGARTLCMPELHMPNSNRANSTQHPKKTPCGLELKLDD